MLLARHHELQHGGYPELRSRQPATQSSSQACTKKSSRWTKYGETVGVSLSVFQALANLKLSLQTELMQLMCSAAPGVSAFPVDAGDLSVWNATIDGPDDTPYAGLTFKLSFNFPNNYPYAAPTVLFKTPIYHPNVDFSGRICLDILKDKWTAAYNIQTVLLSLQSLLGEPNK